MTDDTFKTGGGIEALSGLGGKAAGEDPLVGRELGDYRIIRLIAEGGMGRVYLAERKDGRFERQVALKVSPDTAVSRHIRQRFEIEQGVLASLNHPSIAQLYDARISDEGWLYFVMEHVDGGPITAYCEDRSLGVRERIRLLKDVVDAVAFAHTRLIVHRDIKPGNVLVNAEGRPKLLDFGIAKLLEADAAGPTQLVPMTPRYASPEQLLHQPITTAVDTYQLGLLIYEVLTGDSLNTDTTLREAVARARQGQQIRVLGPARDALPRELVRIIEHCLRTDADDRYRDAGALRDDLEAWLNGYPVRAVGQGVAYRVAKAARRNWLPVSMTALIVVGTVAALVQTTLQRNRLERTQATLRKVTGFQQDMLLGIDAEKMGAGISEDLEAGLFAEGDTSGDAAFRARVEAALGNVNFTDVARRSIDRNILSNAVSTIGETFGDDPLVASALRDVASDVYEAIGMYSQSLPLRERIVIDRERAIGVSHPDTLSALESLGALQFDTGDYAAAAKTFERAYLTRREHYGADDPDTVAALGDYGNMLIDLNRNEEAERLLVEALARSRRVFGERHWSTGRVLTNLGYLYTTQGRYEDALPLWEASLAIDTEVYGAEDPETAISAANLATIYEETGRMADAEALMRRALAIQTKALGATHPSALTTMSNLAINLKAQERLDEAEGILRQAADAHVEAQGADHPNSIKLRSNYASILMDLGRAGEAEAIVVDLLTRARAVLPADHDITGVLLGRYGRSLRLQGRFEEAEAALLEGRRIMVDGVGATGQRKNAYLQHLADLYRDWGRPDAERGILDAMDTLPE